LIDQPGISPAVISGRRLAHIRKLVPLTGILLAGTYGIEIQEPGGTRIDRVRYETIRPPLEAIKQQWLELTRPHQAIYLEDKGWSLALHAKDMQPDTASDVLRLAGEIVQKEEFPAELFRVMGGHRFLEVAPRLANKGTTLRYLLNEQPLEGALPVYIGDDDKDEEAFAVIQEVSGVAIKVETRPADSMALVYLKSPHAVRQFLAWLL
jgi:trehalose 6-phosphate phosphatase